MEYYNIQSDICKQYCCLNSSYSLKLFHPVFIFILAQQATINIFPSYNRKPSHASLLTNTNRRNIGNKHFYVQIRTLDCNFDACKCEINFDVNTDRSCKNKPLPPISLRNPLHLKRS